MNHIVWEALNSEEATYLWHFEKSIDALRKGLKEIEDILNEIKASNNRIISVGNTTTSVGLYITILIQKVVSYLERNY